MSDESRKSNKKDLIRECLWTLLLTVAFYAYCVAMLLIVSFIFNSIINLNYQEILMISAFLTAGFFVYHVIKHVFKN